MLAVVAFVFTSCKKDDDDDNNNNNNNQTSASELLTTYLVDNDMDLNYVLTSLDGSVKFVVGAPADSASVPTFIAKYYIMDLRNATDFASGHIEGAVNVAFSDILTASANAGDKEILTVCYTGQTACYAAALLRLYGFPKAQALKWGMSGWNTTFDKWTASVGNLADGNANWNYDAAPSNVKYDAASISSTATDGASILLSQVEAVVADGFKTVTASDVITTPSNYFINNYFSEVDYLGFGHIAGAYRINPLVLSDESILNLDPEKEIVTYCYTGQTSAVVTAYLRVMGYDAYSLKGGMNALYNSSSQWTSNQWGVDSNPKNLPYVQ